MCVSYTALSSLFAHGETIPKVSEPILLLGPRIVEQSVVVILPARVPQRLDVVEARTAINGNDGAIDRSAFVPAPAITYPHGPLQEFLHVLEVVVCGPVAHVHALDALCLNLVDAFPYIDAHGLDALHEGTIGDWGTGADERWSEALVSS